MTNKTEIVIEKHAFFRLIQRAEKHGLSYEEAEERAFSTVKKGKLSKRKHLPQKKEDLTFYNYFQDNLSFYVICKEKINKVKKIKIKTVIIEEGKE